MSLSSSLIELTQGWLWVLLGILKFVVLKEYFLAQTTKSFPKGSWHGAIQHVVQLEFQKEQIPNFPKRNIFLAQIIKAPLCLASLPGWVKMNEL